MAVYFANYIRVNNNSLGIEFQKHYSKLPQHLQYFQDSVFFHVYVSLAKFIDKGNSFLPKQFASESWVTVHRAFPFASRFIFTFHNHLCFEGTVFRISEQQIGGGKSYQSGSKLQLN